MNDDTMKRPIVPKIKPDIGNYPTYFKWTLGDYIFNGIFALFFGAMLIFVLMLVVHFHIYGEFPKLNDRPTTFDRQNAYIEECLESEQYTRDECIQMSVVEFEGR